MLINSSAHSMPKQEDIDALALLSPAKVVSYEMENGQRRIGIVAAGLAETLPQAVEKGRLHPLGGTACSGSCESSAATKSRECRVKKRITNQACYEEGKGESECSDVIRMCGQLFWASSEGY